MSALTGQGIMVMATPTWRVPFPLPLPVKYQAARASARVNTYLDRQRLFLSH